MFFLQDEHSSEHHAAVTLAAVTVTVQRADDANGIGSTPSELLQNHDLVTSGTLSHARVWRFYCALSNNKKLSSITWPTKPALIANNILRVDWKKRRRQDLV
jgi:hypothetical protein